MITPLHNRVLYNRCFITSIACYITPLVCHITPLCNRVLYNTCYITPPGVLYNIRRVLYNIQRYITPCYITGGVLYNMTQPSRCFRQSWSRVRVRLGVCQWRTRTQSRTVTVVTVSRLRRPGPELVTVTRTVLELK